MTERTDAPDDGRNGRTDGDPDDGTDEAVVVRQARPADYEAVAAFTRDTWPERGGDYIYRIYHEWIAGDGDDQRTFVAETDGRAVGICQGVVLTDYEAWAQGMRVDPTFRGRGISRTLNDALFDWAVERGATVCRNMVFSSNAAGLGGSRAAGFEPGTEFRWAHPEPRSTDPDLPIREAPDAAWSYWRRSDARAVLGGLALDRGESWAVSELTRRDLHRAAEQTRLFTVVAGRVRGLAFRVRDYEREADPGEHDEDGETKNESTTERWAEYGVGAWADVEACRALFDAIAADAATMGADRTRVLVPETARYVSDVAYARVRASDEPDFVFEADLADR